MVGAGPCELITRLVTCAFFVPADTLTYGGETDVILDADTKGGLTQPVWRREGGGRGEGEVTMSVAHLAASFMA